MSTPPSLFRCRLDHPLRPPAWRWLRANYIVDKGKRLSCKRDDPSVRDAVRFLRAFRRADDASAQQKLWRRLPALFVAHQLYTSASFQRWELEARLLTNEPFDVIAGKCSLTAATVAAYHETFFCVRDRLQTKSYIHRVVIGTQPLLGLKEDDIAGLMKMFAFEWGALFLDELVDFYLHPPSMPERPEDLAPEEFKRLQTKLLIAATILTRTLPFNKSLPKKLAIIADAVDVIQRGLTPTTPAMPSFEPFASYLPVYDQSHRGR